jgi:hypothetical protein
MKLVWIEWKLSDYPWVAIGWWTLFLFCLVLGSWYVYWLCCVPYWSFEPVMKSYQFFHTFFGNVPWKRVGHSKYYRESEVITFSFGEEVSEMWSVANEEERREVCEKWFAFMKLHYPGLGVAKGISETMEWNVYLDEVWNGMMGSDTCLSCYAGVSRSGYEDIILGGRKDFLGVDAEKETPKVSGSEMGWVVSQPIWFHRKSGFWGTETGMERLWNTESLTVAGGVLNTKEKQSVTRNLFTTHHSRLVFPHALGMGFRGIGNVNGVLFRERVGMSMRGVVPLVRFPVYEVELFDISVVSKREMRKTAFLGKMVALNETVLKDMKIMRPLIDWYGDLLAGGVQSMEACGLMTWEMLIRKIKYGFLLVFVWFSEEGGIQAIYFYRDEKRYLLREGEVQGLEFSGRDTIRWLATWSLVGMDMERLVVGFHWSLRELVRVKKTYRILLVDGLGLNYAILGYGGLQKLGVLKGECLEGYYMYNRFYGSVVLGSVFLLV